MQGKQFDHSRNYAALICFNFSEAKFVSNKMFIEKSIQIYKVYL